MRINDVAPKFFTDELLRCAKLDRNWIEVISGFPMTLHANYQARVKPCIKTWVEKAWEQGSDALSMKALSWWLLDGPKVFVPTKIQCQAMEHIEINLPVADYSQPYPAIMIDLRSMGYCPFESVLACHDFSGAHCVITCCINSHDHLNDIATTVGRTDCMIEESVRKFDANITEDESSLACKVLRIALNSCLALSHYGNHIEYLYPKEVDSDRRLAREYSERGKKARQRLSLAVQKISFDQEVRLHRVVHKRVEPGEPTGREMPPHWRSGHWAMQPYGPTQSLRKRILRPGVMVRRDLFLGDDSDSSATYRG